MILYLFTFLAGIVTVLSPCVLPVLPAILSASVTKERYRPLGIVIGLILSFSFFTLSLSYLVQLFGISANILRYIAIVVIALFGLVMLFPRLGNWFSQTTASVGELGSSIQSHTPQRSGFIGGLFLGAALGLVWTPCAGPILTVVITLVATQEVTFQIILLTLLYSIGAGIPLFLIAYGGHRVLSAVPFLSRHAIGIKKCFGFLMILTAIGLFFNVEAYLQRITLDYMPITRIENNSQVQQELNKLRPSSPFSEERVAGLRKLQGSELPHIAASPEITGITEWINHTPLTMTQLRGKVVLIDFWTYSCINCIRTLPYLTSWYDKYKDKGLVIIGVHTPEFEFEKDFANVKKATERFHILYPVALDNHYKTWSAFSNRYWPAHYLVDQQGIVREVHFGEGGYLETENDIRTLLGLPPLVGEATQEIPLKPTTPETYLGSTRASHYQPSIHLKQNEIATYTYKPPLKNDHVGLMGKWLVESERIIAQGNTSTLNLNFIATRVYLVMESKEPRQVTVFLDGAPLSKQYYTDDMDAKGRILVNEARKYDVVNLKGDYGRHQLSLQTPEGVACYAFTFGDEE